MDEDAELKRLRWRCRRGMRELDQILGRYLDRRWGLAPEAEREAFEALLGVEDDALWRWFLGREAPPPHLAGLVAAVLAVPGDNESAAHAG